MMIRRYGAWKILLAMLVVQSCAIAQRRMLTLEETLRLADEQSLDVRKAQAALERSEKAIATARTLYLPQVTATGDYTLNLQRPVLFVAPGNPFNETGRTQAFPIGSRHATGLAIDITQPLYDPLRRMRVEVAGARADVSRAQLEAIRAEVRMTAEKAYYRALYARSERATREAEIATAMANLDITLARYRGGRAMALDTLSAAATVAAARADAESARFNYLGTLLVLSQILDLPNYRDLDVEGKLAIPTTPGPSGGDLTLAAERLNSASVRLAEVQVAAARTDVALEGATVAPTVNAVGRWQALGQSDHTLPDDLRWAMTSHVGVAALYSISSLWRGNPEREEAEIRVAEAQLELERVRQIDSVGLQSLLLTMEGARAQALAQQAAVEQAQKAVDITMILYKEGRATLLDVENAQSRVRNARLAEDRITLQFLEAYAELKSLAGDGR